MAKISGSKGYCKVGSTIIQVSKWDMEEKGVNEDTTTTETGGMERTAILTDSSGSFEGFYDLSANIHASPPNIGPNQVVTLLMYLGDPANDKKFSVSALIENVSINSDAKGIVKYKATWNQASGTVTWPT